MSDVYDKPYSARRLASLRQPLRCTLTVSTHLYILTQQLYEGGRIGILQHCAVRTIAAAA